MKKWIILECIQNEKEENINKKTNINVHYEHIQTLSESYFYPGHTLVTFVGAHYIMSTESREQIMNKILEARE